MTRKKIKNISALHFNQKTKYLFHNIPDLSKSLLLSKPYLFAPTTNAQLISTMPKCSKYDYKPTKTFKWKSCPHCHKRATNNVAKKCLGCPYVFPAVKNDKRGKRCKRCIRCNTMAKGNRSRLCLVCGSTEFVKGKTPTHAPCNAPCNASFGAPSNALDGSDGIEGGIEGLHLNVVDKDNFIAMIDSVNLAGAISSTTANAFAMIESAMIESAYQGNQIIQI